MIQTLDEYVRKIESVDNEEARAILASFFVRSLIDEIENGDNINEI